MIKFIILVALLAAFAIILLDKLGIRENVITKSRSSIIAQLFSCDFCLSFWATVILSITVAVVYKNPQYLTIPFFSTPITRILL